MKITNSAKIDDKPITVAPIRDGKISEEICFVISPIGDSGSLTRKRADDVFKFVICKVVEPLGYTPVRADRITSSGLISKQIIEHLAKDSLVIADLAEANPNVFFELAIRYVTKKPYIQLKEPNQKLPFDIADTRTIDLDTTDPESIEKAMDSLKGYIGSIGEETLNPISAAIDNLVLQGSKNPITSSLGEIMRTLSEIRVAVSEIGKMPIDQEVAIRQEAEGNAAKQIWKAINLLTPALTAFRTYDDRLPIELKEEVKKIEAASQFLWWYYRGISPERREAAMRRGRTMIETTKPL